MTTTPTRQLFNQILSPCTNSHESRTEKHPDEHRLSYTSFAPPLFSGITLNTTQCRYTTIVDEENFSKSSQRTFQQVRQIHQPIGKSIRPVPIPVFSREGSSHSREASFGEQELIQKKDSNGPVTPPRFSAFSGFTTNSKTNENSVHTSEKDTTSDHLVSFAQRVKAKARSVIQSENKNTANNTSIIESLDRFKRFVENYELTISGVIFERFETEVSPSPIRPDDKKSPLEKKQINSKEDDARNFPTTIDNQPTEQPLFYTPQSQGSETPWIGQNEQFDRSSVSKSYSLPRARENSNIQNEQTPFSSATTPCIIVDRHQDNHVAQSSRKSNKKEKIDLDKKIDPTPSSTIQSGNDPTDGIDDYEYDENTWQEKYNAYLSKYSDKNRRSVTRLSATRTPLNTPTIAMTSPLPRVDESILASDRVYRTPTQTIPGIIIDAHQAKHVCGNLFGTYTGEPGHKFCGDDSTEIGLKAIIDYLFKIGALEDFDSYPSGNEYLLGKSIKLDKKDPINYSEIRISSITYLEKTKSWYFHLFPVFEPRNT